MNARLSTEAEADLDEIWLYVARSSGGIETANRLIDAISECFWLLAQYPHAGRSRADDLRPGLRSFVVKDYVVIYRIEDGCPVILHVLHGRRDIAGRLP